jgi:serine/threonine-protein kinase
MEYVKGKLLRDVLHERRLSIEECVSYTTGILTALEFSHKAGVIHRDIKSANIMITDTNQVKVMDFGIARAISDSTATQVNTVGIMGTAQYFSPEQAKGETVDARTDLYSTGVLLYEMLAGRPPFKGDTAVSVAYQHVSEAVVPASKFNEYISPELDQVVLHALAKNRDDRFQSAEDFRDHLIAAANGSPMHLATPAPLAGTAVASDEPNKLDQLTAGDASDDFFEQLLSQPETAATTVLPAHPVEKNTDSGQTVRVPEAIQPAEDDFTSTDPFAKLGVDARYEETETSAIGRVGKPRAGLIWGFGSAAAVIVAGLLVWVLSLGTIGFNITPGQGGIAVPDVTGQTFVDASAAITGQQLLVIKQFEQSETVPLDSVIRTDPIAGTKVPQNTSITVWVSSGAQLIMIPNLLGMTEQDATTALTNAKLTLGTITQSNSATYPKGQVISSDPVANTQIVPGTVVNLIISNGLVMVPDVRNLSINDARTQLSSPDVGLNVTIASKNTCSGTLGTIVLEQSIPAGTTAQKSAITLYVACNN